MRVVTNVIMAFSEEEDADDYPFPLTLKTKRSLGPNSPIEQVTLNGATSPRVS